MTDSGPVVPHARPRGKGRHGPTTPEPVRFGLRVVLLVQVKCAPNALGATGYGTLAVMANDHRRYQVFVSSTFLDLRDQRQAVTAALLECDAFPSGMELFPAADDDAWTLIKKVIDECDYYLLVIGGKYGSIDPLENMSYTQMEYEYAVSQGKPVMAFLHGDPGSLAVRESEVEADRREKLDAFRDKVKAEKHVKYWTNAEGLAGQVALSFNKFVRLYPATGWIRADRATSTESLQALSDARAEIERLQAELRSVRTSPPPGVEGLSQGGDTFKLPILASGKYLGASGWRDVATWLRIQPTWDEILGVVGPKLFNEASEIQLRTALETALAESHYDSHIAALAQTLDDQAIVRDKSKPLGLDRIHIDDEDFGTILTQFKALELIRNSEKKRSVNDTETYWTLTPYGENQTIRIRAVKRSPDADAPVQLRNDEDEKAET